MSSASTSASGRPVRAARPASTSRRRWVSVAPGATQLTVTPSAAYSRDSSLAAAVTPARSTTETARSGCGWRTIVEVMNTSRPNPRDAMSGNARRASRSGPNSSRSAPARQASSVTSRIRPGGGPPALSTSTSSGAYRSFIVASTPAAESGAGSAAAMSLISVPTSWPDTSPSRAAAASSRPASRPVMTTWWVGASRSAIA
jgi:hypothetical protein